MVPSEALALPGDHAMSDDRKQYGEGNYQATCDYNARTKRFIDSGKVDEAAAKAEPRNEAEAEEMREAEEIGKRHMKEEDPALRRKAGPGGQA
jgi:hypothetical protein